MCLKTSGGHSAVWSFTLRIWVGLGFFRKKIEAIRIRFSLPTPITLTPFSFVFLPSFSMAIWYGLETKERGVLDPPKTTLIILSNSHPILFCWTAISWGGKNNEIHSRVLPGNDWAIILMAQGTSSNLLHLMSYTRIAVKNNILFVHISLISRCYGAYIAI